MSRVIKGNRVLFDRNPMQIKNSVAAKIETKTVAQSGSLDVGKLLSQNALETAEISIKSAVKEVESIKQRGKVESHFAHLNGLNEGVAKGNIDGENKGREDGKAGAAQSFKDSVKNFLETVETADSEEIARKDEIRSDCINFAFSIAGTILGMDIDSDNQKYQTLLQNFLKTDPEYVTVEADGNPLKIKTLRAEALISAAGDLQGILAYKTPKADNEAGEIEKQPEEVPQVSEQEAKEETEQTAVPLDTTESRENTEESFAENPVKEAAVQSIEETPVSEPEEEKISVQSFEYKNFGEKDESEPLNKPQEDSEDNGEKFVFMKPTSKKAILANEKESMTLEDIADFDKDALKNIFKTLEPGRIAAALQNETDEVVNALTSVLSRKNKEKVIEAIKYLGPVPEEEADEAKAELISLAAKL